MPAGNFDDRLTLLESGRKIRAEGPIDTDKHDVIEMCVWVVQRADLGGDVVANAMGEPEPNEARTAPTERAAPPMPMADPAYSDGMLAHEDGMGNRPVAKHNRWRFVLPLEHGAN